MKLFLVLCTILATFDEAFFGLRHTLPMAPKGVKERGRSKPALIKEPIIDSKSTLINTINALEKDNCVMYSPEDHTVVLI